MINMVKLGYVAQCICWVYPKGTAMAYIACSELNTNIIRIYDGKSMGQQLHQFDHIHQATITCMKVPTLSLIPTKTLLNRKSGDSIMLISIQ